MAKKKELTPEELEQVTWANFPGKSGIQDALDFWLPQYDRFKFDLVKIRRVHGLANTTLIRLDDRHRPRNLKGMAQEKYVEERRVGLLVLDDKFQELLPGANLAFKEIYDALLDEMHLAYAEAVTACLPPLVEIADKFKIAITKNAEVLALSGHAKALKHQGLTPLRDYISPWGVTASAQSSEREVLELLLLEAVKRGIGAGLTGNQGIDLGQFNRFRPRQIK